MVFLKNFEFSVNILIKLDCNINKKIEPKQLTKTKILR